MCNVFYYKLHRHDAKSKYEYCMYFCSCGSTKSSFTKKLEGGKLCIKSTTASHLWGSFALPPTPFVVLSLKATAVHGEKWCAGDRSNLRRWNNYEPTVLKGKLEAGQRKAQSLFSPFAEFKVDFSLWQHFSQSKICICICILLVIHKMLP